MTRLSHFLRINPIIVKEIRSRMRGPRAFITLTLILIAVGGVLYAMLQLILAGARYSNILSPQIGQAMFAGLAFLELFMICAITPAVTSGAISGEKEKQTYEMLMATPLSPASILWGKLISALSYVLLLVFAGIPLASIVFIFGGVALREMAKVLLLLLFIAVAFGILGLFLSALFGRTGRATVAAFILVFVLMIGPIFLAALVGVIRSSEPPRMLLMPSPISALSSAMAPTISMDAGGSLFYLLSGIFNTGVAPISQVSIPRPLYHYTIPFYAILSAILYLLAGRLVRPTRRWRIRRSEFIIGAAVLLVLVGLVAGGYLLTAPRYEWAASAQNLPQATTVPLIAQPVPVGPIVQKEIVVAPVDGSTPTPVLPPTATPANPSSTAGSTLSQEEQASIYAAVVRQLYTKDHTFGNVPPNWPELYLISITDDTVGDPNAAKGEAVTLPKPVPSSISEQLADLPTKITWIASRDELKLDPQTGEVNGGKGAIITLGNIYQQPDGTVHVSAGLYFAGLGGAGKTYILTKSGEIWTISGTTGVEWIS